MKASTTLLSILLVTALLGGGIMETLQAHNGQGQGKRRDRIETVIIGKFATELELTPEQSEQFFPRFGMFRNQAEDLQRRQAAIRGELDSSAGSMTADQEHVNELLNEMDAIQQQSIVLKRDFLRDVSAFLTPQQVSRCSVLLERLPQQVHQFIEEQRSRSRSNRPR